MWCCVGLQSAGVRTIGCTVNGFVNGVSCDFALRSFLCVLTQQLVNGSARSDPFADAARSRHACEIVLEERDEAFVAVGR
jgi:hypothetical protein